MSGGPTFTGREDDRPWKERYKGYINPNIKTEDWCTFVGECEAYRSIQLGLCNLCKYRKELNIPEILRKANKPWVSD